MKIATAEVLDQAAALARVDGDMELLSKLVRLSLDDWPRLASEIRQAVAKRDGRGLARTAHTLKSSVGNFAARDAFKAAQRLERMGSEGDLTQAEKACVTLELEIDRLRPALAGWGEK